MSDSGLEAVESSIEIREETFPSLLHNTSSSAPKPAGFSQTVLQFLHESACLQQEISRLSQPELPSVSSLEASQEVDWTEVSTLAREGDYVDIDFGKMQKSDWIEVFQDLLRQGRLYRGEIKDLKTELAAAKDTAGAKSSAADLLATQLHAANKEIQSLHSLVASLQDRLRVSAQQTQENSWRNKLEGLIERLIEENVQLHAAVRVQSSVLPALEAIFHVSGSEEVLKVAESAAQVLKTLPLVQRYVHKTIHILLGKAPDQLSRAGLKAALERLKELKRCATDHQVTLKPSASPNSPAASS
jgi:uncharacterized protein YhaN